MSAFDIEKSLKNAERRLATARRPGGRRPRSDRGVSRLDPRVQAWVQAELSGYDRPPIAEVIVRMTRRCREAGLRPPSRATVYKLLATTETGSYRVAELPPAVQDALYNLGTTGEVPGHQLAFYCFNYGSLTAVSFASGLPWLALHRALRLPGYRTKSRGLIEAVARVRGI